MSTVPVVSGLGLAEASASLAAAGYFVGAVRTDNSDVVALNLVIETFPPEGTELEEGQSVIISLSLGPVAPLVPDVVNATGQVAVSLLQQAGFQVKGRFVPSPEEAGGLVVEQDPEAGTPLFPPGPVTISIGAPPVVDIPPPPPEIVLE
jgi:beta-lactam-binding protein with PASTA domain